jgi:hypothetical protein
MKQRPKRVFLDEKLADWSAAYLAMWTALESFDPKADRWSDPIDFGGPEKRLAAADQAIARASRHGADPDSTRDIQGFRQEIDRLTSAASQVPDAGFLQHSATGVPF